MKIKPSNKIADLMEDIKMHIGLHVAKMPIGAITDVRNLFDPEFWNQTDTQLHRYYGSVISMMVNRGLLPLVPAGWDINGRNNLYRKI